MSSQMEMGLKLVLKSWRILYRATKTSWGSHRMCWSMKIYTKHDVGDDDQESSQQTRARPSSSSHSEQPSKRRRDDDVTIEMMSAIATNVEAGTTFLRSLQACIKFGRNDLAAAKQVKYDPVSRTAVLSTCSHGALVEEGEKYFEHMQAQNNKPTQMHYACMADLRGRAGFMEEAVKLIESLPMKPAACALLGAC
ncbi:hypothetical protein H0E87_001459 [Populus deltoides]|uniref:Pentatricopeptide repeat-containing protein n=1 Tax=Populus deltoides TaxID=3696 RepID=A0A8T2ZRP4_POPDE|nr:hypothetical protein H0E87_001459 [Populus deltoides]